MRFQILSIILKLETWVVSYSLYRYKRHRVVSNCVTIGFLYAISYFDLTV